MVIVDTSVWIDYPGVLQIKHTSWLDRQLTRQRLGLRDLIFSEVLQGIRGNAAFTRVRRDLSSFRILTTGGKDLAVAAAQNYRSLRKSGHTVSKTIDCLIATFCLEAGHLLLHRDQDFDPFEKLLALRVIHP